MAENEESGFAQQVLPRRAGQVFWGTGVLTINALKAIDSESRRNLQVVFCNEIPGFYYYNSSATDTENSPTVITPTDSTGRWFLIFGVAGSLTSPVIIYKQATEPTIVEGYIWYDTVNKQWRGCNGTDWNTILG